MPSKPFPGKALGGFAEFCDFHVYEPREMRPMLRRGCAHCAREDGDG
jgi:hypothetical protein